WRDACVQPPNSPTVSGPITVNNGAVFYDNATTPANKAASVYTFAIAMDDPNLFNTNYPLVGIAPVAAPPTIPGTPSPYPGTMWVSTPLPQMYRIPDLLP